MSEAGAVAPRGLVVTVSNRAAAGVYPDTAGPLLVDGLRELGLQVDEPQVVPDGEPVREALAAAVRAGYAVVLTTGGTGLTPTDRTPEMTRPLLDREVPGIAEAVRARGVAAGVDTAMLSRGLAGLAGSTLVVNLPGSPGACRDGLAVLSGVLRHAVDQVRGGDHPRSEAGAGAGGSAGARGPAGSAGGAAYPGSAGGAAYPGSAGGAAYPSEEPDR